MADNHDATAACRCGSGDIDAETDGVFGTTIIECCKCGRMVGAATIDEAARMWAAASRWGEIKDAA